MNNNKKHQTRRTLLIAVSFLFIVDILIYVLALNKYYFINSSFSVYLIVFIAHFLYLYGVLITISKTKSSKVFWGVISPFFIVPVAVIGWFLYFYSIKVDYYYLSSPKSSEELIIGYSNWSLGETNHYYDFYQPTAFPTLKKQLNKEQLHIMTRYTNANDLEVLGALHAKWTNEQTVIFSSKYLEIKKIIHLN